MYDVRTTGIVEWFDDKLGSGLIRTLENKLVNVHFKDIQSDGEHRTLEVGSLVSFELQEVIDGKKLQQVKLAKKFSPVDYVSGSPLKKFVNWSHKRQNVRYMWIYKDGHIKVNMVRYYLIRLPFIEIYLHQFFDSDNEVLHNHPWSFFTIFLHGEYKEELEGKGFRILKTGDCIFRKAECMHRIEVDERFAGITWTLVFSGVRKQKWGFRRKKDQNIISPEQYSKKRKLELRTYKDFKIKGILFPKLQEGQKIPYLA